MDPNVTAALFGFIGTAIGGLISWFLQKQRNDHELEVLRESHKTDFAAESTALFYLLSEKFTDRSFKILQERIGGFPDDELRKILVRAGAVRIIREDKSEWWRLLERNDEAVEKIKERANQKPKPTTPSDRGSA